MAKQEAIMAKVLQCKEGDILLAVSLINRYGLDPDEVAEAVRADIASAGRADPVRAAIQVGMSANTLLGLYVTDRESKPGMALPREIEVTDPDLAGHSLFSLKSAVGVLEKLDETNPVGPAMQGLFNDIYSMVQDKVTLPEPRAPRRAM